MCCKIGVTKVCITKCTLKLNVNRYNITECTIKRKAYEYHITDYTIKRNVTKFHITECTIKLNVTEFHITEHTRKLSVNDFHVIECKITRHQIFVLLNLLQNVTSRNSCSVCHKDLTKNLSRITRLIQNVSLRSQTSGI